MGLLPDEGGSSSANGKFSVLAMPKTLRNILPAHHQFLLLSIRGFRISAKAGVNQHFGYDLVEI